MHIIDFIISVATQARFSCRKGADRCFGYLDFRRRKKYENKNTPETSRVSQTERKRKTGEGVRVKTSMDTASDTRASQAHRHCHAHTQNTHDSSYLQDIRHPLKKQKMERE